MPSTKLLPCPFCGGTPIYVGARGGACRIKCYRCLAGIDYQPNQGLAADVWNTRVPTKEPPPSKDE